MQLDKATNRLATPTCPDDYVSAFIAGTEPHETCDQGSGVAGFFSRLFGGGAKPVTPPPDQAQIQPAPAQDAAKDDANKKKGLFGKIAGIFKDDKSNTQTSKPPDGGEPAPH